MVSSIEAQHSAAAFRLVRSNSLCVLSQREAWKLTRLAYVSVARAQAYPNHSPFLQLSVCMTSVRQEAPPTVFFCFVFLRHIDSWDRRAFMKELGCYCSAETVCCAIRLKPVGITQPMDATVG